MPRMEGTSHLYYLATGLAFMAMWIGGGLAIDGTLVQTKYLAGFLQTHLMSVKQVWFEQHHTSGLCYSGSLGQGHRLNNLEAISKSLPIEAVTKHTSRMNAISSRCQAIGKL